MFTEAERVQIRSFLGWPQMWTQADPTLESAITVIQPQADGGTRPDNSAELLVRSKLTALGQLETALQALWSQAQALQVDEINIDPVRARAMLCADGRRLINAIAIALSVKPRRDYFGRSELAC